MNIKPIEGFIGYFISDTGRVFSNVKNSSRNPLGEMRELKTIKTKTGYHFINLFKNKQHFTKKVHRLVAFAFLPNHENKPHVCHKNDIRDDNRVENLFWGTNKDNVNDKVSKNRQQRLRGETNGRAKLSEQAVKTILNSPRQRGMFAQLGRRYGVDPSTIAAIVNNKNWKHLNVGDRK